MHRPSQQLLPGGETRPSQSHTMTLASGRVPLCVTGRPIGWYVPCYLAQFDEGEGH